MQSGRLRLIGALEATNLKRRRRPHARIDAQRGPGRGRQGDHDRGDGAYHRELRHLGRGRHAARIHRLQRRHGRRRQNLLAGFPLRVPAHAAAVPEAAAPAVHYRAGARHRPRPSGAAADDQRSGGRRGGAQARARRLRRRAARDDHGEPRFPGPVRRLRPAEVRLPPARQRPQRALLRRRIEEERAAPVHHRRRSRPASPRRRRW